MRAIVAVLIVLAVALVVVNTTAAAPGSDVKSSPLFKRSLAESIGTLEGKAPVGEAAAMPTGRPGCEQPNLPSSPRTRGQMSTCEPSVCGGITCGGPTCQGWPTCANTCWSTCSGATCSSTCSNTCVPGACTTYHFYGTAYWVHNGNQGTNWFAIGDGIVPYWTQDGHGIYLKFNDESGPSQRIAYVNYNNGTYSGSKTRTTTSVGVYMNCNGNMTATWYYPNWWWTIDEENRSGPLGSNTQVNFYVDVSPGF